MEKTRVINGNPAQSYPIEWIEENQYNFVNGAFVKDWILAPKYNGNFIKPKWNGTDYYEGATPEEIAEQELEKQKILKQQQYEELLETDWYVVRFVETGIKIPEEILQQRQDIRNKYK